MIGIVADDITGANDIGIMYAKEGIRSEIYSHSTLNDITHIPYVTIIDTNSRLDCYDVAYQKIFNSTLKLQSLGCKQYFNKTCSVFRGNIGAEFDAMLDALKTNFAVIVLGFPKNGRVTINGIHYVHGKKLSESEFHNDPVHPMQKSSLIEILREQTSRKVSSISIEIIRQGSQILKVEIEKMKSQCNYLILDVENQESLKIIAKAIKDEKVICGASGIAEELAKELDTNREKNMINPVAPTSKGVLCVAGSLMPQTYNQINRMKRLGYPTFEMKSDLLFTNEGDKHLLDLAGKLSKYILQGKDVLVYSTRDPETIHRTKQLGKSLRYSEVEVARKVSVSLALIVQKAIDQTDVNRLLLAGGETSASICHALGINSFLVWKEIEPGLPSCISLNSPPKLLVLKSGSFGREDFFIKAITHLKNN